MWNQLTLAEPYRKRRHFDEFVVLDIGNRLLERHWHNRGEPDGLVLRRGTDVRELLCAQRVDVEVVVLRVLADDHALIHLGAGNDEKLAALLEVPERIGHGLAFAS